jgi:hypothetical protein
MPHYPRILEIGMRTLVDVIIGAADAHAPDLNENFALGAPGLWPFFDSQISRPTTHD